MAQPVPHQATDKKRVKVYELRNNDWFDRGTGFCTAQWFSPDDSPSKEPRVTVESEDHPERLLLETRICKEDGFQKQQETLIVWTEPSNGVDMALSFQEAEGCSMIWKFIGAIQQSFSSNIGHDDNLSDDLAMDIPTTITLPAAELGSLPELEHSMRVMSSSAGGREALTKCIMSEDYIRKLIPLVGVAEDLESLNDLHHLCNIVKIILLLNDTSIIEHAVSDDCVLGVVGALEYDPDFPSHKANHRSWLNNQGRYKEVVRIQDELVRRKIHQTYRLQYLKDVVLARILDDPTFSVLNSLIFFNQVDIVQHLQANTTFMTDLFGIFADPTEAPLRKKEAVLFIQQCCAIAKNLQPPARMTLYSNFIGHGLLQVINFALRSPDVSVRVGGTDILVAMIDHDPQMIRGTIYRQIQEKHLPLTDPLIELLLIEVDLGIKSHISEALKVLLDTNPPQPVENFVAKGPNGEFQPRPQRQPTVDPQQEVFLGHFYEHSAPRLFRPLLDLEGRKDLEFSVDEEAIFSYLNEIMTFYVRQHHHRSKYFILSKNIAQRFVQLLGCSQKHLQLVAIRFFRQLVTTQDEFYIRHIVETGVLGPILDVLLQGVARDNLLSSACLDFFELFKKDHCRELVKHLVEKHREKLQALGHLQLFQEILMRGDQPQGFVPSMDPYFMEPDEDMAARRPPNAPPGRALMEHIAVDPEQEAYWNGPDEEEDTQLKAASPMPAVNGSPAAKPLVDYVSDEETDENGDTEMSAAALDDEPLGGDRADEAATATSPTASPTGPPERLSEKRRREEEEDDEMGKLMQNKRRNSGSTSLNAASAASGATLRKKSLSFSGRGVPSTAAKKISISISSPALKAAAAAAAAAAAGPEEDTS